jgi:hypothetical protein
LEAGVTPYLDKDRQPEVTSFPEFTRVKLWLTGEADRVWRDVFARMAVDSSLPAEAMLQSVVVDVEHGADRDLTCQLMEKARVAIDRTSSEHRQIEGRTAQIEGAVRVWWRDFGRM